MFPRRIWLCLGRGRGAAAGEVGAERGPPETEAPGRLRKPGPKRAAVIRHARPTARPPRPFPVHSKPEPPGSGGRCGGGVTRSEARARRHPRGGAGRGLPGANYIAQNSVRLRRLAPRARLEDPRRGIGRRHPPAAPNGAAVGRSSRIGGRALRPRPQAVTTGGGPAT